MITLQLSVLKMTSINTYVFMDLATVDNKVLKKNIITELSLLVVHRSEYLEPNDIKQPKEKKTFRFYRNPDSGDDKPEFDMTTFYEIMNLIDGREKPICLIAHNGDRFDFPILKFKLQELNVSLPDNVKCADSRIGFRYILERSYWRPANVRPSTSNFNQSRNQGAVNLNEATTSRNNDNGEVINSLTMQRQNETTPSKRMKQLQINHFFKSKPRPRPLNMGKVRRSLFTNTPVSYELKDIFKRVVQNLHIREHPPENDNLMMFKISQEFGNFFVNWVDQNQRYFANVEGEYIVIDGK